MVNAIKLVITLLFISTVILNIGSYYTNKLSDSLDIEYDSDEWNTYANFNTTALNESTADLETSPSLENLKNAGRVMLDTFYGLPNLAGTTLTAFGIEPEVVTIAKSGLIVVVSVIYLLFFAQLIAGGIGGLLS